jgi:hypothetical protein
MTKPAFPVGGKEVGGAEDSENGEQEEVSAEPSVAAYDAPRVPLWDFLMSPARIRFGREATTRRRRNLGMPSGRGLSMSYERRRFRREATTRRRRNLGMPRGRGRRGGMTLQKAMASLPEHSKGRVRYLVDTFERLSSCCLLVSLYGS